MQYIIVSFIVLGIFVVTTMMLCGMRIFQHRNQGWFLPHNIKDML